VASFKKGALTALGCAAFVYAAVYVDLVLRARTAYLEGEKYMEWAAKPELKKAALEAELAEREKALRAEKLTAAELEQRLALARFEHEERVKESSYKYAYVWYQTAVELFSPPDSKWVRLAREKLPVAKELWKKELDAAKIPYKDYMLE
jgi:hypothetical protein